MIYKLKKNKEFKIVYKRGKSIANNLLVLYILKNKRNRLSSQDIYNKVGISVSKKVGNSVVRSRVKRLIFENYRLKENLITKGYDFIFVARTNVKDKDYHDIEKSMDNLFKKAGLYNDKKDFNKSN